MIGLARINENGAVLVIALMFMAILGLLGTTAFVITSTDLQVGGNYRANAESFYDADAGVNYAIGKMEEGLKANPQTFTLPPDIGNTSTLSYTVPGGFSFLISAITKTATNTYSFTSTGSSSANAQTVLTVTFERDPAINYAAFGDQKLDTKNGGSTLSYDSSSPDPAKNTPSESNSTHEADVGSNDWLVTHNGALIDGSGVFGEKADGSPTTNGINGGTIFYGTTPVNAGRIDPDPLGVLNAGGVFDPTTYSASNDNDLVSGLGSSISGTITLVGNPGADVANYYLTAITLNNGETLTIDTTYSNIRIFLTGGIELKNGSSVVMYPESERFAATKFAIFSNSTSEIDFKHDTLFTGLVYAPNAPVEIKNSADVYGAIWGKNVDIKNTGALYYDSALRDKYFSNNLSLTTWKDNRS